MGAKKEGAKRQEKQNAHTGKDLEKVIGSPRRKARLVELMREEIHFTDEAIARFAKTRLQIDADY